MWASTFTLSLSSLHPSVHLQAFHILIPPLPCQIVIDKTELSISPLVHPKQYCCHSFPHTCIFHAYLVKVILPSQQYHTDKYGLSWRKTKGKIKELYQSCQWNLRITYHRFQIKTPRLDRKKTCLPIQCFKDTGSKIFMFNIKIPRYELKNA